MHGMHGMHDFIWLASQSPRRRELLGQIGVAHQLLLPEAGEGVQAREALETLERLSRNLARAAMTAQGAIAEAALPQGNAVTDPAAILRNALPVNAPDLQELQHRLQAA